MIQTTSNINFQQDIPIASSFNYPLAQAITKKSRANVLYSSHNNGVNEGFHSQLEGAAGAAGSGSMGQTTGVHLVSGGNANGSGYAYNFSSNTNTANANANANGELDHILMHSSKRKDMTTPTKQAFGGQTQVAAFQQSNSNFSGQMQGAANAGGQMQANGSVTGQMQGMANANGQMQGNSGFSGHFKGANIAAGQIQNNSNSHFQSVTPTRMINTPSRALGQIYSPHASISLPQMISPMRVQVAAQSSHNCGELEKAFGLLRYENETLKRQLTIFASQIQTLQSEKVQNEIIATHSIRDDNSVHSYVENIAPSGILENQLYAQNISLNTKDAEINRLRVEIQRVEVISEENFRLKSEIIALSNLVETLKGRNSSQEKLIISLQNNEDCSHNDELIKENLKDFDKLKSKLIKKKAQLKHLKSEIKEMKYQIEDYSKLSSNNSELTREYNQMKTRIIYLEDIQEKYNQMLGMFVSVNAELESLRSRVQEESGETQNQTHSENYETQGKANQLYRRTSGHFMNSEVLTKEEAISRSARVTVDNSEFLKRESPSRSPTRSPGKMSPHKLST